MRAILCKRLGPPSELSLEVLPEPVAGPDEVVVDVAAVGLNFFDVLMIAGRYQLQPSLPFSPGAELAGSVAAIGDNVRGVAVGDRVGVILRHGGCREKVVVRASEIVPLPAGVPAEAAASLFVAYGTALHALRERGGLQPGETVAILGAAGGIGHAAIEIGKLLGARVVACVSSEEKAAFAAARGADATVNYRSESLKDRLRQVAGPGPDVILDLIGGAYSEAALRAIRPGGRYLVAGFATGDIPRIPLNLVLLKSCDVRGVILGEPVTSDSAKDRHARTVLAWYDAGRLRPHVDAVYPLEETARGLERIRDRAIRGKAIVLPQATTD